MINEKTARLMYAKNREMIAHHKRGSFIVNFYKNYDVRISADKDNKAEFGFILPRVPNSEFLDVEFNTALNNYITYGKNYE
jgi:hypothetical protein